MRSIGRLLCKLQKRLNAVCAHDGTIILVIAFCSFLFRLKAESLPSLILYFCFFFNDTAPTEIYTLSLHDALPIWPRPRRRRFRSARRPPRAGGERPARRDRKSTRLNSSHVSIAYAVFCLKKKKKNKYKQQTKKKKETTKKK